MKVLGIDLRDKDKLKREADKFGDAVRLLRNFYLFWILKLAPIYLPIILMVVYRGNIWAMLQAVFQGILGLFGLGGGANG